MKFRPLIFLALLAGITFAQLALADDQSAPQNLKLPVQFTQIQDLDPSKQGINRPVKQKWAVVVGISKFADHRLNTADDNNKTARKFYDYLVDPKFGRFRADHVRLLTDEDASQQSIDNALGQPWLAKLAGPDDLVVVYVASKAFPTTDGNSYICSHNCRMDNIYGTCMSIQSLMQTLKANVKSDRVILVLECAYSGSAQLASGAKSLDGAKSLFGEKKADKSALNVDLNTIPLGKGFIIITASAADQLSWKDLFTDNLILALKEKDGRIGLDEAFYKARKQTEYDSIYRVAGGSKQTPQLKSDWKGNDLVLGCTPVDESSDIPESVKSFMGAEAYYLQANRLISDGKIDEAIEKYKLAVAADPELADAVADYAVALSLKNQWEQAEAEMRKALLLKPKDALYLTNYARILEKLGRPEDCKKALEKAYVINPKDRIVLTALSDKCVALGDKQTAMQLMDQTLVLYPNNASAHDRMAFLLSLDGRNDEALSQARQAVQLDPDLLPAHLKLGSLLAMTGDLTSAIGEYQTVLNKNPKLPDAHFLLAEALLKQDDKDKAIKEFKQFLDLAPQNDPRRAKAQSKLEALGAVTTQ